MFTLFCSEIILKECCVIFNIRVVRKLKIDIGYRCYFRFILLRIILLYFTDKKQQIYIYIHNLLYLIPSIPFLGSSAILLRSSTERDVSASLSITLTTKL